MARWASGEQTVLKQKISLRCEALIGRATLTDGGFLYAF